MKRVNLLDFLCSLFPAKKREQLLARILCGDVLVNGERIINPKQIISVDAKIALKAEGFVSRGGVKLDYALNQWAIPVERKVLLDAGSSTGGFTHCLLKHGASKVYAVDVGYNLIDYSLRINPSVVLLERTNIMAVKDLSPQPHGAVADLSFRSIRGVASHLLSLTREKWLVALIKPQFELSSPANDFNGIIRDQQLLETTLTALMELLRQEGAFVSALLLSPIRGRKGNYEFLFLLTGEQRKSQQELFGELKDIIRGLELKRSAG